MFSQKEIQREKRGWASMGEGMMLVGLSMFEN